MSRTRFTYQDGYPSFTRVFLLNARGQGQGILPTQVTYTWPSGVKTVKQFEFASALPINVVTFDTWNNFDHYKVDVTLPKGGDTPYGIQRQYAQYVQWLGSMPFNAFGAKVFGILDKPYSGIPILYAQHGGNYEVTPVDVSNLKTLALRQMLPKIRPKLLTLSELYQLKDLKSVKYSIQRVQEATRALAKLKFPKGLVKKVSRISNAIAIGRWVLSVPADVYLQWKFNVQPTIEDIGSVYSALSSTRDAVRKLLDEQRMLKTVHYSAELSNSYKDSYLTFGAGVVGFTSLNGPSGSTGAPLNVTKTWQDTSYSKRVFHAQLEYSYEYSQAEAAMLQLNALLDSLGVGNNPVKDLWEVIPWSFVVDWVVGVSQWLDNLETNRTKPRTAIHKWCWSVNVERKVILGFTAKLSSVYPSDYPGYNSDATAAILTESAYKRGTDGLSLYTALTGSGISLEEFILGSSLAVTRKRRN